MLSETLRVILKFFEKRRTLLNVAEIYTLDAYADTDHYSQLTYARKKIQVYLTRDIVAAVPLRSAKYNGMDVVL